MTVLNELIETCRNGQAGFAKAASEVADPHLRKTLGEYSEQRAQFALQIGVFVRQIGGEPEGTGSVAGALHRGLMAVKSAVTGGSEASILAECARGEDSAVATYRKSLGSNQLPPGSRELVETQLLQIEEVRGRIAELLAHVAVRPAFD